MAGWPAQIPPLRPGRLHEISGEGARAFAAIAAATRAGPVVWIETPRPRAGRRASGAGMADRLDPYGLAAFFAPQRLIRATAGDPEQAFWTMEEALRSGAAPTVVAETGAPADLTRSRRLQLAAEAGAAAGTPPIGLLLLSGPTVSNAAETRWRAEPCAPTEANRDADLDPHWRWRLEKNKRGPLGDWTLRWGAADRTEEGRTGHGPAEPKGADACADQAKQVKTEEARDGASHRLCVVAPARSGERAAA